MIDDDDDEASGLPTPLGLDSRISDSATDSIGKKFDEDPLYPYSLIVNYLNKSNFISDVTGDPYYVVLSENIFLLLFWFPEN